MCNLYTARRSAAEIAAAFKAQPPLNFNVPDEVYPGYPGLVVREDDGQRMLQSMVWGLPLRLASMKPDSKPKPVNNCADIRKPLWVGLARKPQWRCIIPFTGFAEAEGAYSASPGVKSRLMRSSSLLRRSWRAVRMPIRLRQ